jgi:hypothetical protein
MTDEKSAAEESAMDIAALLPALRKAEFDKIVITYEGENGEGNINIPRNLPPEIQVHLVEYLYDLLPEDWTDTYGGSGQVIIDLVQGMLTIHHLQRVVSLKESRHSYALFATTRGEP